MESNDISFEEHYNKYCNPSLTTKLLRQSVPLLDYVNWKVEEIKDGYCQSIIPVKRETTNQHTTLQSSTFFLAADYTGGIALYTLLRGLPTFGVHPAERDGLSLWLIRSELKFKKPVRKDLKISSIVPVEQRNKIRERFFSRKPVIERLEITFENNGNIVSKGFMTYFAQLTDYNEWLQFSSSEILP